MSNGGIIGPTNDPVQLDLVTEFTSSGTYTTSPGASSLSALIVAGGGNANGGGQAGSGGAGGYRNFTSIPVSAGSPYTITVGGAASNSSGFGYTASAGGNGVAPRGASPGGPGGSGGGCGDHYPGGGGSGGSGNSGSYTPPEGNPGSGASPGPANTGETPGAGGGSAGAGTIAPGPWNAKGGAGSPNTISGSDLWYATGGCYPGPIYSPEFGYPARGQPSLANTGNGAQGEGPYSGGSGVIVVSEPGAGAFVGSGVWSMNDVYTYVKQGEWS
tara:strand:+ start:301 stop:1116 length:816 start_codon:yes stop_codon:yes gene_type:complete